MENIAKAIIAVMKAVKGVDKNMTVGSGTNSYKGVADKDVKEAIGNAMQENGLCVLPVGVESKTQIDRWEETSSYGNKIKQQVLTEVFTKYMLLHESGESIELAGYGHGVDSQDKAAGKATTYALKNALLYAFMVPTGKIDDTDNEHSDDKPVPQTTTATKQPETDKRAWLNPGTPQWKDAVSFIKNGIGTLDKIEKKYRLSAENKKQFLTETQEITAA